MSGNNNNLVYIGPLWGTKELAAEFGECERINAKPKEPVHLASGGSIRYTSSTGGDLYELEIIRKPTWTWCENPTDEMAKKRPRCEVRDSEDQPWAEPNTTIAVDRRLVAVGESRSSPEYISRNSDGQMVPWRYCRVRLDANGDVMEVWDE